MKDITKDGIKVALVGVIAASILYIPSAFATLKVWATNERIQAVDLNGNFAEHDAEKIGGGVQAVNADIASNAAISHSKLATPALVPKGWARVTANCTGSDAAGTVCTTDDKSNVTSITTTGSTGIFRLNLAYTPADANFTVIVSTHTASAVCMSDATGTSAPHALIKCFDYTGAANNVNQFSVLVMDT